MTKEIFLKIIAWQKETFPKATAHSKIHHLREELYEVLDELESDEKDYRTRERSLEFADCFLLLFGAAAADGMTYEDICRAIEEKFAMNLTRNWGKPDKNGVVKHVS